MKSLITGSLGFVGTYLREELESNGYDVIGLDIRPGDRTLQADLMNAQQITEIVAAEQPDVVFHLAGQADVGKSWKIPQATMELNVVASINLMEAVRAFRPETKMVMIGSSDQYGNLGAAGTDVREELEMKPQSPYAISKRAQEEMAKLYCKSYAMNICMTRSFNHGGAGQRTSFMIPDFAWGIVRVERGEQEYLSVGNLTSRRDFTHVKDVVRAYRLIAEKGRSGEVYNVGSGKTYSAQEVLDMVCKLARCPITVCQDPSRMRPSDTPIICCNHDKLTAHTGWEPSYTMEDIVQDTLGFYRVKDDLNETIC